MRRRAPRGRRAHLSIAVLGVVLVALAAACASTPESPPVAAFTPPPRASASSGASASSEVPESPIVGLVTNIDSEGLDKVKGFTLRASNGEDLTFVLGTLENAAEFAPGHLAEHMAAADPVLVYFRLENGALVVYRLDDAP
jgi:hypothetical protein